MLGWSRAAPGPHLHHHHIVHLRELRLIKSAHISDGKNIVRGNTAASGAREPAQRPAPAAAAAAAAAGALQPGASPRCWAYITHRSCNLPPLALPCPMLVERRSLLPTTAACGSPALTCSLDAPFCRCCCHRSCDKAAQSSLGDEVGCEGKAPFSSNVPVCEQTVLRSPEYRWLNLEADPAPVAPALVASHPDAA